MTGKSHIAMNFATILVAVDTWRFVENSNPLVDYKIQMLNEISDKCVAFLFNQDKLPQGLFICISLALFTLGSLLPDVDHENSILGRFMHIPVAHRTWTHAIYIPLLLIIAGIFWHKFFLWLGLGYFFHLFWDSFSRQGIHYFYPSRNLSGIRIYSTGGASEYVFVCIFYFLAIGLTYLVLKQTHTIFQMSWLDTFKGFFTLSL